MKTAVTPVLPNPKRSERDHMGSFGNEGTHKMAPHVGGFGQRNYDYTLGVYAVSTAL